MPHSSTPSSKPRVEACESSASRLITTTAPPLSHRRLPVQGQDLARFGIDLLNVSRSTVPAVTHVDYSARVQTVTRQDNPRFHDLLQEFNALTGCPVLINTSFNVRGEPIVCTPEDAFRCFMGTGIDVLAAGNCYLRKQDQSLKAQPAFASAFEPD